MFFQLLLGGLTLKTMPCRKCKTLNMIVPDGQPYLGERVVADSSLLTCTLSFCRAADSNFLPLNLYKMDISPSQAA